MVDAHRMPENTAISEKPRIINIGIIEFAEALNAQGARVVHVDWKPLNKQDQRIRQLLDKVL